MRARNWGVAVKTDSDLLCANYWSRKPDLNPILKLLLVVRDPQQGITNVFLSITRSRSEKIIRMCFNDFPLDATFEKLAGKNPEKLDVFLSEFLQGKRNGMLICKNKTGDGFHIQYAQEVILPFQFSASGHENTESVTSGGAREEAGAAGEGEGDHGAAKKQSCSPGTTYIKLAAALGLNSVQDLHCLRKPIEPQKKEHNWIPRKAWEMLKAAPVKENSELKGLYPVSKNTYLLPASDRRCLNRHGGQKVRIIECKQALSVKSSVSRCDSPPPYFPHPPGKKSALNWVATPRAGQMERSMRKRSMVRLAC